MDDLPSVPRLTIDRNLMIAVHKAEPESEAMQRVFAAHRAGKVEVAISAANRVENQMDCAEIQTIEEFIADCDAVGLVNPRLLDYPMDWDIGLWEHGIASAEAYALELRIHTILHPSAPTSFSSDDPPRIRRRTRNRRCDVFAMWGHIWFGRDFFLTKDDRFIKCSERLQEIGARGVIHPLDPALPGT